MRKINRTRNRAITIRMTEAELAELQQKVKESGLPQQTFVLNAIHGATIRPSDEVAVLKEISSKEADVDRQLRGLGININQMAHVANTDSCHPALASVKGRLNELSEGIALCRKENAKTWQLIKSLINLGKTTVR